MGVGEDLTLLERLPDWVMWDGQALFALRTPELLTGGRGGSPSLPTPTTVDSHSTGRTTARLMGGDTKDLALREALKMLPTPQHWDHKVFGPAVDWKKRAENHADSVASVIMNLLSDDGNESSDDKHLTQLTIEDCDPPSSLG